MPQYSYDDIVMIADENEDNLGGTPAILKEIFGSEALVKMEGQDDRVMTVPLERVEPFYRTPMEFAH